MDTIMDESGNASSSVESVMFLYCCCSVVVMQDVVDEL